jgi:hypothetical protein
MREVKIEKWLPRELLKEIRNRAGKEFYFFEDLAVVKYGKL